MNDFRFEKLLLPIFRSGSIITLKNNLIDPTGFNLKEIPGRSYKIFEPVFSEEKRQLTSLLEVDIEVICPHMLAVRREAYDVIGEEYLFIRGYRVGHTLELETIVVVLETQVKGGCHCIDETDISAVRAKGAGMPFCALRMLKRSWLLISRRRNLNGGNYFPNIISHEVRIQTRALQPESNHDLLPSQYSR
jgi:hypothetical protein